MRLHLIYLVKNEKDHSIPEWNEPIGAAFKSIRINQIGLSHIKFLWGIDSIYQLMTRNIRALGRRTSSLKITIKKSIYSIKLHNWLQLKTFDNILSLPRTSLAYLPTQCDSYFDWGCFCSQLRIPLFQVQIRTSRDN